MYYLGFDVGTSALKTILIDDNWKILYESSKSYQYQEPKEGYKEIDPECWFYAVDSELRHAAEHVRDQGDIIIGVTGQMHTTVFLDKKGQVIRPAIMWNDLRTKEEIAPVKQFLKESDETEYISGIYSTGSPAANVLWVKEHEPENFKRIGRIMTAYDYIVYRLTGHYSVDYCDASTSAFYDIQTKSWSERMLKYVGIEKDVLGKVHKSCDMIGEILPEICDTLKLSQSVKIIAGTGDNPATAAALGILEQGDPIISLGTSGVVIWPRRDGDFEGKGKNVLFLADGEEAVNIRQGVVQAAGGAHRWWIEHVVMTDQMAADQDKMDEELLGENSVLFYPHIAGDKTLYADPNLRGAFLGLSTYTRREHMTQAVFEGVAFALRELLESMGTGMKSFPKKIRVSGGGSKSCLWMKILSNVLNMQIEVNASKASPGYGICLLAMKANKKMNLKYKEKKQGTIYTPDPAIVKKYETAYKKYQRIHDAIAHL